ncbi:MAG: class I SAM-dependent methyltransferase [Candidatus Eremiobacteraeota bacterium]|nr:class I SAM-dependent methyltransferase [Candidatus Eremiobacteraeota bacterium]
MLFLSEEEKSEWRQRSDEILRGALSPGECCDGIRPNLIPVFYCYAGTLLSAKGLEEKGASWIREGAMLEEEGVFFNSFLSSFLERHGGRLVMPAVVFQDPAPFLHFAGVPTLKEARAAFRVHCAHSLPVFTKPFRIMDIGCGDGGLLTALLSHLRKAGRIGDIAEIVLLDASRAMCAMAEEKVGHAFPQASVRVVQSRIENFSGGLEGHFDVMLSSLAYHHMPRETKLVHLKKISPHTDHFIIFEVDSNNDTPEQFSPELALSVYQSYGSLIDWVFSHDAPLETAIPSVDAFLMMEAVSFFIQGRGARTDYHMLRPQWHDLFREGLGSAFTCRCDSIAYSDEYINLYTIHYGR